MPPTPPWHPTPRHPVHSSQPPPARMTASVPARGHSSCPYSPLPASYPRRRPPFCSTPLPPCAHAPAPPPPSRAPPRTPQTHPSTPQTPAHLPRNHRRHHAPRQTLSSHASATTQTSTTSTTSTTTKQHTTKQHSIHVPCRHRSNPTPASSRRPVSLHASNTTTIRSAQTFTRALHASQPTPFASTGVPYWST